MATTKFDIHWQIDAAALLAKRPEENIDRIRKLYFEDAAREWSHVVVGWPTGRDGSCLRLPGGEEFSSISVKVDFKEVDGEAEVVARVDAEEVRAHLLDGPNGEQFPTQGTITIDLGDLERLLNDQPRFKDTIVHEIGHILGLGTLFDLRQLVTKDKEGPWCVGPSGCEAYANLLESTHPDEKEKVPLHAEIESSTPAFHWEEEALEKDVMSTLLDRPGVCGSTCGLPGDSPAARINVISTVSAGTLQDLGYVVDVSQALRVAARRRSSKGE